MRLAYLCNLYPAVSHTFVRREIEAIEGMGHEVYRFSLRPSRGDLRDPADLREAARTEAILARGAPRLLAAGLRMLLSRPAKAIRALSAAWRLSPPGIASRARHAAYWLEAAWLARRLQQLGVEHLHAHFGTNPAAVALLANAMGGPAFSVTIHGSREFDAPVELALGEKVKAATFIATISRYTRSQVMRWSNPADWHKVEVVRCGVDQGYLDAAARPVPADSTEFLFVGRLSAPKGLPLLIAACERLRSAGERFSLTIVGDGELRGELEEDIRRRDLQEVVTLAGVRSAEEIREFLERARAFVLPSFAEGVPVVIMEALALRRPVITTPVGGIPELVDHENGWVITPGSEEALVEAMAAALHASAEELAAKGVIGNERVGRMHDARKNAELILDAIARRRAVSTIFSAVEPAA